MPKRIQLLIGNMPNIFKAKNKRKMRKIRVVDFI